MLSEVLEIAKQCIPTPEQTENEYRTALAQALRAALHNGTNVIEEFKGVQNRRLDIAVHFKGRKPAHPGWALFGVAWLVKSMIPVDERVFIEIKKDLQDSKELDRLIGQIAIYKQGKHLPLLVLLAGETHMQIKDSLEEFLKDWEDVTVLAVPYPPQQLVATDTAQS